MGFPLDDEVTKFNVGRKLAFNGLKYYLIHILGTYINIS